MTSRWRTVRIGDATVTYGLPFYGKQRIIANAPLTAGGFAELASAVDKAWADWNYDNDDNQEEVAQ